MDDDFLYEPKPKKNITKVFAGLGAVIAGVVIFAVLVFSSLRLLIPVNVAWYSGLVDSPTL